MKHYLYNYPFLFIFSSILAFVFYKAHNSIFWLFFAVAFLGIFRVRIIVISLLVVITLYLTQKTNSQYIGKQTNTFKGTVYDIRKNRHLTFYVKTKNANLYLFVPKVYDNIRLYDKITFKAKVTNKIKNPAFRRYLHSKNIYFIGYASKIQKTGQTVILSAIEKFRQKTEKEFYYFLKDKEYIFLQNAIFGDSINKSSLRDMFVNTQTAHIMSVSGLHMGFVFGLFYALIYFLFSNLSMVYKRFSLKHSSSIFAFIPTLLYFAISGFHIPAIRSFIMVFVFIVALIYGYSKNSYNTLFFAATVIALIFGYKTALTPSFVMSFLMSFIAIYLYGFIKNYTDSKIIGYLIFSFLIGVFAMPISAFYFHKIAYLSFLSNFIIVPYFGFVILPLAFISIFASLAPIFLIKQTIFFTLDAAVFLLIKIVETFSYIKPLNINLSLSILIMLYGLMFVSCEAARRFLKSKI